MNEVNILIIDDEETMCSLLRDTLSEEGYKVSATQNAKEALEAAKDNSFDLVITDLKMPEIDGLQIVKQIKEFDEDNVVIVITAYPSFETVQEALRLGAYDYITKPFDLGDISFTVKKAMEFRELKLANKRLMEELEYDNVILEKKVEENTWGLKKFYYKMQSAYMATVKALAKAIEAKDHYTCSHSENVTKYAVAIANEMGFSPQDIEILIEACQLHDLGKISVHDGILNKRGKLTPQEWEEIKLHSLRGAEILKPLAFLEDVTILIRQHHERYDGKGYPDGLKAEEITLGARVIATADAYDAMTSERPYRKAFSKEEAVFRLKQDMGTQFDPQVVKAFMEALKKDPMIIKDK